MAAKKKADLKVIIMGDYAVGKTSFICRYIEGKFKTQEPTIGAAFFLKQWGPYNIAVWDTAGDERYTGLSNFYCRNAGVAILAFDINNVKTFESLWARFTPLLESANKDCLVVIVGTKLDLVTPESREILVEEGKKLSMELNEHIDTSTLSRPPYFETSSLNGHNVKDVFEFVFQHCLPLSDSQRKNQHVSNTVDLYESTKTNSSKKKCC
ncbi:ras-related protein Rab-20-like [Gigantopelta aegis]|uniref:ras-related protein Rab-20-like n=1 Tax=Gigantopelta aegis TaxID=1735272 RepID=UPI001B888C0A|nr:ras-related protein Rab-20-like [Gigantopelta aegis]